MKASAKAFATFMTCEGNGASGRITTGTPPARIQVGCYEQGTLYRGFGFHKRKAGFYKNGVIYNADGSPLGCYIPKNGAVYWGVGKDRQLLALLTGWNKDLIPPGAAAYLLLFTGHASSFYQLAHSI